MVLFLFGAGNGRRGRQQAAASRDRSAEACEDDCADVDRLLDEPREANATPWSKHYAQGMM